MTVKDAEISSLRFRVIGFPAARSPTTQQKQPKNEIGGTTPYTQEHVGTVEAATTNIDHVFTTFYPSLSFTFYKHINQNL